MQVATRPGMHAVRISSASSSSAAPRSAARRIVERAARRRPALVPPPGQLSEISRRGRARRHAASSSRSASRAAAAAPRIEVKTGAKDAADSAGRHQRRDRQLPHAGAARLRRSSRCSSARSSSSTPSRSRSRSGSREFALLRTLGATPPAGARARSPPRRSSIGLLASLLGLAVRLRLRGRPRRAVRRRRLRHPDDAACRSRRARSSSRCSSASA